MIIEKFHAGKVKDLYKRFEKQGRLMPDGLRYINSWVAENLSCCYQIMETDKKENLDEWVSNWKDLVDFEIIPVITSDQAKEKVFAAGESQNGGNAV